MDGILASRKGNLCPKAEGFNEFTIQYNVTFIPCAIYIINQYNLNIIPWANNVAYYFTYIILISVVCTSSLAIAYQK